MDRSGRNQLSFDEEVRRGTRPSFAEWAESVNASEANRHIVEGHSPQTPRTQDVVQLVLDLVAGGEASQDALCRGRR